MTSPTSPRDEKAPAEPAVRFEPVDVDPGLVARWAVALGAVTVVTAGICVWLLVFLRHREEVQDPQRPPLYYSEEQRQPEGVRLQSAPFTDLHTLREQEHQVLSTYGWVDQAAGVVHIPIEQAMTLYLQRHGGTGTAAPPAGRPSPAAALPTDSAPVPAPAAPSPSPAGEPR